MRDGPCGQDRGARDGQPWRLPRMNCQMFPAGSVPGRTPSGAVEQQRGVGALGGAAADFLEMASHGLSVGELQRERGPDAPHDSSDFGRSNIHR